MIVLGIAGQKRSGKGEVAKFVKEWAEERGLVVEIHGFSDLLKLSIARVFFPEIEKQEAIEWCDELKECGRLSAEIGAGERVAQIHGRQALQNYGTEAHRGVFGDDFWVDALLPLKSAALNYLHFGVDLIIVSDLRFENEAQRIVSHVGYIWEVQRPPLKQIDSHVSERPLPRHFIDKTVRNEGTLERLREKIRALCLGLG